MKTRKMGRRWFPKQYNCVVQGSFNCITPLITFINCPVPSKLYPLDNGSADSVYEVLITLSTFFIHLIGRTAYVIRFLVASF